MHHRFEMIKKKMLMGNNVPLARSFYETKCAANNTYLPDFWNES